MDDFFVESGPHIKDKDHISRIMRTVMIALLPIVIFTIYKNGIIPYQKGYINLFDAFRPLIIILLAMITSFVSELLYTRIILRKKGKDLADYMRHCYALMPGLFLALVLPLDTPLFVVVLGSIFASIIGKMVFGGFGHNIFNPALMGSLFVTTAYGSLIASRGGYLNGMEVDTISTATPLTHLSSLQHVGSWHNVGSSFGSLWDYFFGFIPGALGETSKLLILIAMLYLIFNKVIKWRIPITYMITVFVMTWIIGQTNGMGIWFPTFQLLSGSLLFGAVFMATDPVTSPVTKSGQFLYGLGLGILTVIFRFLSPYPEGVLSSILTMNMLVFIIDKIGVKAKLNMYRLVIPIAILLITMIGMSMFISYDIKPESNTPQDKVQIISKNTTNGITTYVASTQGFHGPIKAQLAIANDKVTNISVITEEETYWQSIVDNNYLNKLIEGQDALDKVDTVSGATVSSSALKLMVKEILSDYKSGR